MQAHVTTKMIVDYAISAELGAIRLEQGKGSSSRYDLANLRIIDKHLVDMHKNWTDWAERSGGRGIPITQKTVHADVRAQMAPSLNGWVVEATLDPVSSPIMMRLSSDSGVIIEPEQAKPAGQYDQELVLGFSLTYRRSTSTRMFAVCIVLCMWLLSAYLFVLAVDHVIVRRRPLQPDTVGFSVGMLFALPALRLLMQAPFGRWVVTAVPRLHIQFPSPVAMGRFARFALVFSQSYNMPIECQAVWPSRAAACWAIINLLRHYSRH
jgi:hypothetical protein